MDPITLDQLCSSTPPRLSMQITLPLDYEQTTDINRMFVDAIASVGEIARQLKARYNSVLAAIDPRQAAEEHATIIDGELERIMHATDLLQRVDWI